MSDTSISFTTKSNGTIDAVGILGSTIPNLQVGGDVSLDVFFSKQVTNHVTAYETLRQYVRYSNQNTVDTGLDIYGEPYFRETLYRNAPFTSVVVKFDPQNVAGLEPYWAVITGGEDKTSYVGATERLSLELFLLAPVSEYPTRSDVEGDLEAGL